MAISSAVRVAAILVVAIFIAGIPSAPEVNTPHTYLGLDRNDYPGDEAMKLLRKDFAFTGYWLSAPPGEKTNTWQGKRELVRTMGFGFVVLYNGPDSGALKTEVAAKARGTREGDDAVATAKKEGFAGGTIIFLDIEEGGRLPDTYHAYLAAWSEALSRAGFRAGAYCSGIPVREGRRVTVTTADDIRSHDASREIAMWIFNDVCPPSPGCTFPQNPPAPARSNISYAAVWQFAQSPRRKERTAHCRAKYGADGNCYAPSDAARRFHLDVNSANSPDPSGGAK